jgi:hypothetical protein
MITVRTAIAGIAAIVVLVFAGAGAGALFSSNSSNSSAVASASARTSSCATARGARGRLVICQIRGSLAPPRSAIGMAGERRFHMRGGGGVAGSGWAIRMRGCVGNRQPSNIFRDGNTLASQLARKVPKTGNTVPPVVAELFGGGTKLRPGGPQPQIRLCATPAPMNRLPRAGSPGRGSAPPTSSSQRRG